MINFEEKRFEYWDSLNGTESKVFSALREYMTNECPQVSIESWHDWIPTDGPQQENGYDCGVFACQIAEHLSRRAVPSYSQTDMQELRKRMAVSILEQSIQ